ncbi:hypothetical protein F0L68_31460 [Solihabitans fulvus]|uniref:SWIM-type domain-containing protein n=1 Tax=Solihabitans fulvus TaxID=1892852 RepID=A0A5B2WS90_9PSEU|nr:SWIM zinc finger family protein [Solihabitans fulvus]KAA2253808.1 hypothetical protein F0L68_31460 [Solihabitans fulvus]
MTERIKGFPAFPPGARPRGQFARTWWGNAWIKALEDTSLDAAPLAVGRRYAHTGLVGTITVSPGRIEATVHDGTDDVPYRTLVLVEELTDAEWERLLDQVAGNAGHIAALLDKDMPHDLVAAAEDAGVRLLPGIGDLVPECGCPGWEHPCKHAAALCYQASWLLDADPFVLLLMRGRGQDELLAELQRRNGGRLDRATEQRPAGPVGVPAARAYAAAVAPLPAPPPAPEAAGPAPSVASAPGLAPDAVRWLVADAALRARDLLAGAEPLPRLDVWRDTVRLAATHHDASLYERLREASGRPAELDRAARAWECGGSAGLDTLEQPWHPAKADLARAGAALAAAGDDWPGAGSPEFTAWRNRWTAEDLALQLRYGRDGRWYPYRQEDGEWWPAGMPGRDPAAALAELLGG